MNPSSEQPQNISIITLLWKIAENNTGERITIANFKEGLHEQGFWLLMIPFTIPFILPIPYPPGFSTIMSLPLMMLCLQVVAGKTSVWFPDWVTEKSIKHSTYVHILTSVTPWMHKIEKLIRPRFNGFISHGLERCIGGLCLILALIIATPIPFSHFLPGIATILIAISLINRDGIGLLIGSIIGITGISLLLEALILGEKAIISLFHLL